jgi:hypothetical protein
MDSAICTVNKHIYKQTVAFSTPQVVAKNHLAISLRVVIIHLTLYLSGKKNKYINQIIILESLNSRKWAPRENVLSGNVKVRVLGKTILASAWLIRTSVK